MPLYPTQIRLQPEKYRGRLISFVTICGENRSTVFCDIAAGRDVIEELARCAIKKHFVLHAFCLMPDHLHALVEGMRDDSDLIAFISLFKQSTGFAHKRRCKEKLWQTRFYDHILRKAEAATDVALYIWWNPGSQRIVCSSS
jgi:REP-associated tyrosine transposase